MKFKDSESHWISLKGDSFYTHVHQSNSSLPWPRHNPGHAMLFELKGYLHFVICAFQRQTVTVEDCYQVARQVISQQLLTCCPYGMPLIVPGVRLCIPIGYL